MAVQVPMQAEGQLLLLHHELCARAVVNSLLGMNSQTQTRMQVCSLNQQLNAAVQALPLAARLAYLPAADWHQLPL